MDRVQRARDGPGRQPRAHGHLARQDRRDGPAQADQPPRGGFQRPLDALQPVDLLPVDPVRVLAGLEDQGRRRRGRTGHPPASRCRQPHRSQRRPGLHHGSLPRPEPGSDRGEARGDREGQGHRAPLREALRPPLGHLERRPPVPPFRHGDARRRRGQGPHAGHGRRHAQQALRRARRDRLHSRRTGPRLHGQGRRPRGGLVHGL